MTYPHSTKAIVTSAPKEGRQLSWALQDVKLRDPKEDEVLVRIIATGICHTDLAISMTPPELTPYPRILGHEGAGVVISTGSSVKHVKKGDYVLMSIDFCGRSKCYNCSSGTPGFCTEFLSKNILGEESVYETEAGVKAGGMYFGQSSFAGMALVKEKSAINVTGLVRDEEELKMFAPFGCGFQTGAGAVTELAGVTEKDTVAVFGLGGVGMVAVMVCFLPEWGGGRVELTVSRLRSSEALIRSSVSIECSRGLMLRRRLELHMSSTLRISNPWRKTLLGRLERSPLLARMSTSRRLE